jgi:hypothetical protein
MKVHRTGVLRVPRAVKAITVAQEPRGSGPGTRSAETGRLACAAACGGAACGGAAFGGTVAGAVAVGARDVGEGAGAGGLETRWLAPGAAVAGALADPSPPDCTDAGSAAAQGTRPHSLAGPEELSCSAKTKPPPASAAMVAVRPAAVTQRCRAMLSTSRAGPVGGWPGPLVTPAHRLIPGRLVSDRLTRDMAVSPILVRPLANPSRRGQLSNVTGTFDDEHIGMGWRYRDI